jgi:PiT family inorganic phosphate transporter
VTDGASVSSEVAVHLGFALSTTHVATGSILGSGVGRPGALVRWRVAGRMVAAWLITLPSAAVVGAIMWWIGDVFGGVVGALAIFVLLCLAAAGMWLRSRRELIDHSNVNDDWDAGVPADRVPAAAAR